MWGERSESSKITAHRSAPFGWLRLTAPFSLRPPPTPAPLTCFAAEPMRGQDKQNMVMSVAWVWLTRVNIVVGDCMSLNGVTYGFSVRMASIGRSGDWVSGVLLCPVRNSLGHFGVGGGSVCWSAPSQPLTSTNARFPENIQWDSLVFEFGEKNDPHPNRHSRSRFGTRRRFRWSIGVVGGRFRNAFNRYAATQRDQSDGGNGGVIPPRAVALHGRVLHRFPDLLRHLRATERRRRRWSTYTQWAVCGLLADRAAPPAARRSSQLPRGLHPLGQSPYLVISHVLVAFRSCRCVHCRHAPLNVEL